MTAEQERRGALEALDRILNRGGDADDVLRDVVAVLGGLYPFVRISFVEGDELVPGPVAGAPSDPSLTFPIAWQAMRVAELEVGAAGGDDRAFLERVALLVSPYCLVGWDTGGEAWSP